MLHSQILGLILFAWNALYVTLCDSCDDHMPDIFSRPANSKSFSLSHLHVELRHILPGGVHNLTLQNSKFPLCKLVRPQATLLCLL